MKNYDVPSAGSAGNYGAPTPHAANVFHDRYVASEGDLNEMADTGHPMVNAKHAWTRTPGESAESPDVPSPPGWDEIS